MKEKSQVTRPGKGQVLSTHVLTEETARRRFKELLDQQHALGSRRPKGRSLYQVVCDEEGPLDRPVPLHGRVLAFAAAR